MMVSGVRLPLAVLTAAAVTFFLFRLMHLLIFMADMALNDDANRKQIDFIMSRQDSQTQTRKRELPQKVKPPKPPENPDIDRTTSKSSGGTAIAVENPEFDTGLNLSGALQLGAAPADSEEVPVVRVEPIYPRRAADQGIEGWVLLKFDVTTTGATTNVKVIDASPKRIFDRAAARAVSKWKYRPKIVDGKAYPKKGLEVRLRFKLD